MLEVTGNIWDYWRRSDSVVCITTNGMLKKDGTLVMGKGIALDAVKRVPNLATLWGEHVRQSGNIPHLLLKHSMMSFPTKAHWIDKSVPELIYNSAVLAQNISDANPTLTFYMPRCGCGNGGLIWEDVKPLLPLSDKFVVIHPQDIELD